MKIAITYEKKDILRLIEQDLKEQGIKIKQGTSLEYKGALEVKLSVETEESAAPKEARPVAPGDPPKPPVTKETPGPVVDDDTDMSSVLDASNRLVRNSDGKVRALGPNESLEFPKD